MKRVTIYDVALEANVSLATVSRVINGVDVVRKDTRERVESAIERLGYKPNAIAQGLALQKTTTIALVIPEASFNFTGNIINGLLDVSRIYHYNIMLHTTTEGISDIKDVVETIIKSHVDGVVIYNDQLDEALAQHLLNYHIPIVVVNNKLNHSSISSVYVDFSKAIYDRVKDYLARGKDKIAIVEDRKNTAAMNLMVDGAKRAFNEVGKTFDGFLRIPNEYHTSYDFLKYDLGQNKYDLIFAYRDSQAFAAINAARDNQLSVPEDMDVICLIDTKYNSMMRPRISSFSVPSYDLGAVAMRVLTKLLKDDEIGPQSIELSYLYTPRESTK